MNLNIQGRSCLVVGGGEVAERKAAALMEAQALVTVVSPSMTSRLQKWAADGLLRLICRAYKAGDATGFFLVIAATDRAEVNACIAAEARRDGALVNVVDAPDCSDYTLPALLRRGELTIAVSTEGASPALSRFIRRQLAAEFGPEYAQYLILLRKMRDKVKAFLTTDADRRRFWRRELPPILALLKAGNSKEAEERVNDAINGFRS